MEIKEGMYVKSIWGLAQVRVILNDDRCVLSILKRNNPSTEANMDQLTPYYLQDDSRVKITFADGNTKTFLLEAIAYTESVSDTHCYFVDIDGDYEILTVREAEKDIDIFT